MNEYSVKNGKHYKDDGNIINIADKIEQIADTGISVTVTGVSTEAKQDTTIAELVKIEAKEFATQTTLAQVLAKIITAPATEAKQDTAQARLDLLSTEAKQDTIITALGTLGTEAKLEAVRLLIASLDGKDYATQATLQSIKDTDGIKKITDTVNTKEQGSGSLVAGQNTTIGTTAAAIAGSQEVSELLIQADNSNTVSVFIGSDTAQFIELQAGASITIPANNLNLVYAKTATGTATINYLGRA